MDNTFLATGAGLIALVAQRLRGNVNDAIVMPIVAVLAVGLYAIGADTFEPASRLWWQGSVVWIAGVMAGIQGISSLANVAGDTVPMLKQFQTRKMIA